MLLEKVMGQHTLLFLMAITFIYSIVYISHIQFHNSISVCTLLCPSPKLSSSSLCPDYNLHFVATVKVLFDVLLLLIGFVFLYLPQMCDTIYLSFLCLIYHSHLCLHKCWIFDRFVVVPCVYLSGPLQPDTCPWILKLFNILEIVNKAVMDLALHIQVINFHILQISVQMWNDWLIQQLYFQ